jgi:hypothetical protein
VLAHAFFEGRQVVAVLDLVELRRLERQRAGAQQRIGGGFGRLLGRGFWASDTGVDSLPEQAASARLMAAARTTVRDM